MKICYVIPSGFVCGGNRIVGIHCRKLAERGHDMSIALINPYMFPRNWIQKIAGEKVNIIGFNSPNINFKEFDAIVATYFQTVFNIKEIENRLSNSCEKYYFVQQLENRMVDHPLEKAAATYTYSLKDFRLFTEARWIQKDLEAWGRDDVSLVPNAQELPKKVKLLPRSKRKVVLIEGSLAPKKGVADGLRALDGLDCDKWLLTNSQKEQCSGLGFDKVFSRVSWVEALEVIKTADILLKPSYLEGSPTPHMEAMGLGTALVSTNCTGVEEYCVDKFNSLLCNVGDVGCMRSNIRRLLLDDELRGKLVANGLKSAEGFSSWKPSIDKLAELFDWKEGLFGFVKETKKDRWEDEV